MVVNHPNGKEYSAVEGKSCEPCAFADDSSGCRKLPAECSGKMHDGKSVYWIEVNNGSVRSNQT